VTVTFSRKPLLHEFSLLIFQRYFWSAAITTSICSYTQLVSFLVLFLYKGRLCVAYVCIPLLITFYFQETCSMPLMATLPSMSSVMKTFEIRLMLIPLGVGTWNFGKNMQLLLRSYFYITWNNICYVNCVFWFLLCHYNLLTTAARHMKFSTKLCLNTMLGVWMWSSVHFRSWC